MPYLSTEVYEDEYGVKHASGTIERCDMISNPIAIVNRTIPMAVIEGSISFILDKVRKHAYTLDQDEAIEFIFDVLNILNKKQAKELRKIYDKLDDYEKKEFLNDCISLNPDGTLRTDNGLYLRWEAFSEDSSLRDNIIKVYEKYGEILAPYHIFIPKPKWGRDIYIGEDAVGYQYMFMLKQSGESNFSGRSSGSISEEGLPEKNSKEKKSHRELYSTKPIKNYSRYKIS